VNRKQRRANKAVEPAKLGPRELFAAAVQHHREGRQEDAARFYRQVLAVDPRHADSLHRLGVIAHQKGQHGQAVDLLHQAIACRPDAAPYHAHLGLALDGLGRLEEAVASCRKAVSLDPGLPDLHNNLGVLLQRLGRREDAIACYRRAAELAPDLVEAHNNLGNVLLEAGKLQEAEACYRRVIHLAPGFAEGHANLGAVLKSADRFDEAAACFQRALRIAPAQVEMLAPLALTQLAMGDHRAALATALSALAAQETPQNRRLFVQCVKDIRIESEIAGLRPLLLRALYQGWDRPEDLARPCADLIKQTHAALLAPEGERRAEDLAVFAGDELLQALLCMTPNQDLELEALLTAARRQLLQGAPPQALTGLDFACALARQCFINEYVFAVEDEEAAQARRLSGEVAAALEQDLPIHPFAVAAIAAYFPLLSLPHATRLLARSWPDEIEAVLTQQIREPKEEEALRITIPRLTDIKDDVSHRVQDQYEENPYPRWTVPGSAGRPQILAAHLRHTFPLAPLQEPGPSPDLDILVAGCGTGRNAIETTQRFLGARTLAIDLSLSSLAHAARKTRALGIQAIDYRQADILELGRMDRRFDLIEAVGVLHHLADPFAGWRILTSLLKPHGFMLVGFYSSQGRRDLPDWEAAKGTADDVRRARRHLIEQGSPVAERMDFFTTSTCRDLLFHVQEHRLTLAGIGSFLTAQDLKLLGFSLEDSVLAAYRKRFPDDPAAVNLDHWQAYEKDHPETFSGMYQFLLQKTL
jgi:Tfp pilus assembly protein PilF/SAM-dependent methyltransferase